MQRLPYVVVTNPHLSYVYELYYKAFERFRAIPEIKTLEDNDRYCDILRQTLKEHLTVIPNLAMGVLECQGLVKPDEMDRFMNTLLRAVRKFISPPITVSLFVKSLTLLFVEDISPSDRRTAPFSYRHLQFTVPFSGF